MKERLDKLVKGRRLIRSRSRAQRMIAAGRVVVDGQVIVRPGHLVDVDAEIEITSYETYVSQGGDKLEAALAAFQVDPTHSVCLDLGASTGGFTDCLLQHGASRVYAVDVGHGQIHPRLRADDRVIVREGVNARYLDPRDVPEPVDLVTVDVSFISLRLVLPPIVGVLAAHGEIIALIKPQFEVGKDRLPQDGVLKDEPLWRRVVDALCADLESLTPWSVIARTPSPVRGSHGNVEELVHLR
jgi:23S rRNA (cytidine1920-2'-O)/16S rRNA (cytidine1409-2'-O)-methyltransferase